MEVPLDSVAGDSEHHAWLMNDSHWVMLQVILNICMDQEWRYSWVLLQVILNICMDQEWRYSWVLLQVILNIM